MIVIREHQVVYIIINFIYLRSCQKTTLLYSLHFAFIEEVYLHNFYFDVKKKINYTHRI